MLSQNFPVIQMEMQQVILADVLTEVCLTQVRDGARVSQDLPNYWDRVQTHSMNIEIRNVNYSDEGHYTLRDRRDRVVSITRMDLTGGCSYRYLCLCFIWIPSFHSLPGLHLYQCVSTVSESLNLTQNKLSNAKS